MRAIFSYLAIIVILLGTLHACKEEIEELKPELPTDYLTLQPGKFITYRLDSTIFYPEWPCPGSSLLPGKSYDR